MSRWCVSLILQIFLLRLTLLDVSKTLLQPSEIAPSMPLSQQPRNDFDEAVEEGYNKRKRNSSLKLSIKKENLRDTSNDELGTGTDMSSVVIFDPNAMSDF